MTSPAIISLEKAQYHKPKLRYLTALLFMSLSLECSAFGTLFTSPQQRETLNQQRAQGNMFLPESNPDAATKRQDVVTTEKPQVFFNGYVVRKSGPDTAWANQQQLQTDHNSFQNGISAQLDDIKGTSVPIKTSKFSNTTRLQPGQFLNKTTGEITEGYHLKRTLPVTKKADTAPSYADVAKDPVQTEQSKVDASEDNPTELE